MHPDFLLKTKQHFHGRGRSSSSLLFMASMTVEASLVLPLFLFFCANLLFVFEMIRFQSSMLLALHEAGEEVCEAAWFADRAFELSDLDLSSADLPDFSGQVEGVLFSEGFVRNRVAKDVRGTKAVAGGTGGISYLQSEFDLKNNTVLLVADYRFRPFVPIAAPSGIPAQAVFYSSTFTGYEKEEEDGDEEAEEETVYVTATGEVYHRDRNCTYLRPSVHQVYARDLSDARNSGGGKYYPCEVCHPKRTGILFVTKTGNRYHCRMDCPSLKRTVHAVKLLWAQENGYRPCSKCGGGG